MPSLNMKMTTEEIEKIIESSKNRGLSSLAKVMVAPLKIRKDYSSIGRSIFSHTLLCSSCGLDVENGVLAGCRECVTRSIMES